jgi:hypothetical protein
MTKDLGNVYAGGDASESKLDVLEYGGGASRLKALISVG